MLSNSTHLAATETGGGDVVGDQPVDEVDTMTVVDTVTAGNTVKDAGSMREGVEGSTDRSQEWRTWHWPWPAVLPPACLASLLEQAVSGEVPREAQEWCTQ